LSLKDLSLARHVTALLDMGVASLKLEGRMKSPDYVGGVVRIFRKLLDEKRNANDEEMRRLADLFSRQGFTDGYFTKSISNAMLGIRSEKDKEASRQITADCAFDLKPKAPITIPERNSTLLPLSRPQPQVAKKAVGSARFYKADTIPENAASFGIEIVYLPLDRYQKRANGVILPPVIFDSERKTVLEKLIAAKKAGAVHALIANIGQLALAKEAGLIPHGDYRLNIQSSYTAAVWEKLCEDVILSPELILAQIRDIPFAKGVIVYGRQILMTLEKPVGCDSLTDRTKAVFPILKEGGRDILINSLPTYMADKKAEMAKIGKYAPHYLFTVEGKQEVLSILTAYQKGFTTKKAVRRVK